MPLPRFAPLAATVVLAGVALAGCGEAPSASTVASVAGGVVLPAGLIVETAPEGAADVETLGEIARDGEVVVAHGWVGGRAEPIAKDAAVFTLSAVMAGCTKSCCAGKDGAALLVVEISGRDGRPLAVNLAEAAGLAPNTEVVVKGRVASAKNGEAPLVIRAESMHVVAGG